jgi:hypothetical protein
MNSASVEDPATVGCSFVLYLIAPPAMLTLTPVADRVLRHAAQFELAEVAVVRVVWRMVALAHDRPHCVVATDVPAKP